MCKASNSKYVFVSKILTKYQLKNYNSQRTEQGKTWESSESTEDESRGGSTHSLLQRSNAAAEYSYLTCVQHKRVYITIQLKTQQHRKR